MKLYGCRRTLAWCSTATVWDAICSGRGGWRRWRYIICRTKEKWIKCRYSYELDLTIQGEKWSCCLHGCSARVHRGRGAELISRCWLTLCHVYAHCSVCLVFNHPSHRIFPWDNYVAIEKRPQPLNIIQSNHQSLAMPWSSFLADGDCRQLRWTAED